MDGLSIGSMYVFTIVFVFCVCDLISAAFVLVVFSFSFVIL